MFSVHRARSGDSLAPSGRRTRYAQVIVFGLIAVLLLDALLWTRSVVVNALHTMAIGEGERFLHEIRTEEHDIHLDVQELTSLIEIHRAEGLRCIVLFDPGPKVAILAGDCSKSVPEMETMARTWRPGHLDDLGERVIMIHRLPRPPSLPPVGFGQAPERGRDTLIEFVPVEAMVVERAATRSLAMGLLATAALLVATVVFWRLSLRSERLQEAMERDRLLARLGQMSAVLVHEIRNPLASLKGHAQLLLERLPESDGAHERAARVVREAVRLERLCEDLLSLFRSRRLDRSEVDPAAVLREAVDAIGDARIQVDAARAPRRWSLDPPACTRCSATCCATRCRRWRSGRRTGRGWRRRSAEPTERSCSPCAIPAPACRRGTRSASSSRSSPPRSVVRGWVWRWRAASSRCTAAPSPSAITPTAVRSSGSRFHCRRET